MADNDDLLDYEDEEGVAEGTEPTNGVATAIAATGAAPPKDVKGSYVSIHSSGFRDFLLKPEILRAIVDCGFEHPSEGNDRIRRDGAAPARKRLRLARGR